MVPDPPDTIDLSAGGGPWPAFTVAGATNAAGVNTSYHLQPPQDGLSNRQFQAANGAQVQNIDGFPTNWEISGSNDTTYFTGTGTWPWTVGTWTPAAGAGGTPAFTRALAIPHAVDLSTGGATAQATLTTALAGTNNDLVFTAVPAGRLGNAVRLAYVHPNLSNAAISVAVSGQDVTVSLATNGMAVITSTAAQVKAAIEASDPASALVTVANAAGNNGSGVVPIMAYAPLSGGTGGLPMPPETVAI